MSKKFINSSRSKLYLYVYSSSIYIVLHLLLSVGKILFAESSLACDQCLPFEVIIKILDSDGSSRVFNNAFDASSVRDLSGGKINILY